VIKKPSEKLFAFTSVEIGIIIEAIQPEALFLFASLAKLTILATRELKQTYDGETILRTVSIFETVSSLHSELFVELKFKPDNLGFLTLEENQLRVTLGEKIGKARERLNKILYERIENIFTQKDKEDGRWPRLTELNMHQSGTDTLNNPELFKKLVPNLRKLNLGQNRIRTLGVDVFKNAEKLIELICDVDDDYCDFNNPGHPIKLTNEALHSLVNLRVLQVHLATLESLESLNYLSNLEQLTLNVYEWPLERLFVFPEQLSKLRDLKLYLQCIPERIAPTAFDHLKFLVGLELVINNPCLTCELENHWLEIGIAPRFLSVVGVEHVRFLGGPSSVANIETMQPPRRLAYNTVQLKNLECKWPLSGLKRLSVMPFSEASVPFNQMITLEFLTLILSDFGMLSRSGLGCLCNLTELEVIFDHRGL
jgi:Leucine-rich repeat (LRR) protein